MRQFRKLIAIAVAAASVLGARADAVSSDLALAAATAWVAANPGFGARGAAVSAEAEYDGATLMWWVVRLADGGAVFVAPETSIDPVLAAVPRYGGALPAAHPLRAILSTDVANRRRVIAEASATPRARGSSVSRGVVTNAAIAAVVSAAETRWTKLTTARPRARAVTPTANVVVVPGFGDEADNAYLRFWNQEDYSGFSDLRSNAHFDPCFNLYTPLSAYTGKHAVCGCVATAGAALLQYFGATGLTVNVKRDCYMDGEKMKLTTISATNHYDWTILPQEIGGEEPMTMLELQQAAEAAADRVGDDGRGIDVLPVFFIRGDVGAQERADKAARRFALASDAGAERTVAQENVEQQPDRQDKHNRNNDDNDKAYRGHTAQINHGAFLLVMFKLTRCEAGVPQRTNGQTKTAYVETSHAFLSPAGCRGTGPAPRRGGRRPY